MKTAKPTLRALLSEFAELYFADLGEGAALVAPPLVRPGPSHLRPGEIMEFELDGESFGIAALYVGYEASLHLAAQLLDLAPGGSSYETAYEVRQVLWEHMESLGLSERPVGSIESIVDSLRGVLERPPTNWEFAADFGYAQSQIPIRLQFKSGDEPFELTSVALESGRSLFRAVGAVRAHTLEGALFAVERRLLEVVGASLAVGVMSLPRRLEAETPVPLRLGGVTSSFTHATQAVMARCCADIPRELSDLERTALTRGDVTSAIRRHLRLVQVVLESPSPRAEAIRNACRVAATSLATVDFGVALTLAFSVLEGLLLDPDQKDGVLGRLTEAVAHALGRDHDERRRLRAEVKRLYDLRSIFVHTGRVEELSRGRAYATELMVHVLRRELAALAGA